MSIEIKRSIKPVDYSYAINLLEERLEKVINNRVKKYDSMGKWDE